MEKDWTSGWYSGSNHCVSCGRTIPEGKLVCWACEYKHTGVHYDCQWFHGSGYCLLKLTDCQPTPCKWYDKDPKREEKE